MCAQHSTRRRPVSLHLSILAFFTGLLVSCGSGEERSFAAARSQNTVDAYEAFLSRYPNSDLAASADSLLAGVLPPIPFASDRETSLDIYTVRVNGTGETRVFQSEKQDHGPMLSPDGSRIVFTSNRDGGPELYVVNVDGSDLVRLTHDGAAYPTWSPDGSRIAFVSERDGNAEIYTMNADGTEVVRLTDDYGADAYPSWSPDGKRIAFARHSAERATYLISTIIEDFTIDSSGITSIDAFIGDIYLVNIDGSGLVRLTDNRASDSHPTWSPDGTRIAFSSQRDGNAEIYVMGADGTNQTRLTVDGSIDCKPLWYAARNKIVFASNRGGDLNVWMMNPDGSAQIQLTNDPGNDSAR